MPQVLADPLSISPRALPMHHSAQLMSRAYPQYFAQPPFVREVQKPMPPSVRAARVSWYAQQKSLLLSLALYGVKRALAAVLHLLHAQRLEGG